MSNTDIILLENRISELEDMHKAEREYLDNKLADYKVVISELQSTVRDLQNQITELRSRMNRKRWYHVFML